MLTDWRLNNADGSWFRVFAPALLPNHGKISAHYREMRGVLGDLSLWPDFPDYLDRHLMMMDGEFYPLLCDYYQAIAHLFESPFQPEHLHPISRYRFFVATEAIIHPTLGRLNGLSGLEQLLGLSHPPTTPSDSVYLTTGEAELDVMARLLLIFPTEALQLARTYPLTALASMARHATELRDPDKALAELQAEKDKELFEQHQAVFAEQGRGIPF